MLKLINWIKKEQGVDKSMTYLIIDQTTFCLLNTIRREQAILWLLSCYTFWNYTIALYSKKSKTHGHVSVTKKGVYTQVCYVFTWIAKLPFSTTCISITTGPICIKFMFVWAPYTPCTSPYISHININEIGSVVWLAQIYV